MARWLFAALLAAALVACSAPSHWGERGSAVAAPDKPEPAGNARPRYSRAEYAAALSEAPGSRRDEACGVQIPYLRPGPPWLREALADQRALTPSELDGSNCIWAAGDVTGEDGRRYSLYVHSWEGGVGNSHWANSLLVLDSKRQFLGWYPVVPVVRMETADAELIVHGELGAERLHFGRDGPAREVLLDGMIQRFQPAATRPSKAN